MPAAAEPRPKTRKPSAARIAQLEAETGTGGGAAAEAEAMDRLKREAEEKAEREASEIQAAAEGVPHAGSVELKGQWFRVAAYIGAMPMMKFASVAESGIDTTDMRSLSAMYALLRAAILEAQPSCGECESCAAYLAAGGEPGSNPLCESYDAGDWGRFEQHAIATKATTDDLFPVVQQAVQVIAARPTRQP